MFGQVGIAYHLAPENILHLTCGPKSDIWSLGVLTFFLMSGKFPFKGESKIELNKNIAAGIVEFSGIEWDSISEDCKNFIRCCLKFDMNDRWSAE